MSQKNFSSFGDLETLIAEIVSKISGKVDKVSGKGLSTNDYTTADKNKVDALKSASTKDVPTSGNASSSQVVMGNDSRLTDSRNAKDVYSWAKAATKPTYTANEVGAIPTTQKGTASGVAELDANGKVPSSQLPSYVDDTVEGYLYNSKWYSDKQHTHEVTGESGKIYVELSTNKTYRWSGSAYVEISASLALGETSSTAYRGDRGKTAYDHSQLTSGNPHNVTKANIGLSNVPNVSTNNQTPTFSVASTRANIASGEKLSVILGKIQKFFNDLKTVAFSGSFSDLNNKPSINSVELSGNKTASQLGMANSNTFQGTIAEWNALSTAEKKAYDHASIPDSIDGGDTFPANKVVMTGGGNVEDAVDELEANFQDGVDAVYDAVVAKGSTPASHSLSDVVTGIGNIPTGITPSGTKSITANGTGIDVTEYANVDVAVPNSNSNTYTYPSGSTGGTVDLGVNNTYRYVNAGNVYNKGKADGAIKVTSQSRSATVPSGAGRWYTITYTFSFAHGVLGVSRIRSGISKPYPDYNVWHGVPCLDISGNKVTIVVNGVDMVGERIDITAQGY